jgi:hypothetical protein
VCLRDKLKISLQNPAQSARRLSQLSLAFLSPRQFIITCCYHSLVQIDTFTKIREPEKSRAYLFDERQQRLLDALGLDLERFKVARRIHAGSESESRGMI